ncbi:MAG TPA: methyltransferase type 11, partial [Acinetobacter radioresistens]|nr:methyltransferase type 11 [Acinetobacter radioresistens]
MATIPDNLLTPAQLNLKRDLTNATATSSDSHNLGQVRDGSGNPTSAHDGGSTAGSMAGQSGEGTSGGGNNGNSNPGVSELHAAGSGTGRDSSHAGQRKRRITSTGLATADSSTSNISSSSGSSTRSKRDRKIVQLAKSIRAELTGKALLQLEAEGTATEWGDLHSIQTALPYLSPEQQEDVLKAETHLFGKNANGMLFTNGTGTGKTFTGLGAVKRFVNAGLKNILIVSMNDKIVRDFVKSGVPLNLDIHQLDGITDNGGEEHNIVATTYANFAQNINLAKKKWDLIVVDESHNLMQSQDGNVTAALRKLRALSGHHDGFYDWYDDHFSEEMPPRETREERSVDDDGNVTVTQFADGPFIPGEATDK